MNFRAQNHYYKILMGMLMVIGILLLALVICLISFLVASPTNSSPKETTPESGAVEAPADTTAPVVNPSVGQTPLPETPDAGLSYQDKLIFVGDSLTAHLVAREVLTGGKMTKQVWRTENNMLNLNSEVTAAKIIYPETGESMTIAEAAGKAKPEIMIVTLGTDWGVSYLTEKDFKTCYTALIRDIQAASPETTVILQSIFPVTTSAKLKNEKIDICNGWVREIAADCGCPYLDTQTILKGADNALKPEYCNSSDGIHLHKEAYVEILKYIRTHAYTK
ncbi:MAG: hypothetical protein E7645_02530 [Ruminococcaceae bacterium]|nr:hypothetical protein [Oscillospiraceae bacterium]